MAIYVKQGGVWRTPEPYVKHEGVWKKVQKLYVKHEGVWKKVQKLYVKHEGVWKEVYANLTEQATVFTAGTTRWVCPDDVTELTAVTGRGGEGFAGRCEAQYDRGVS